LPDIPNIQKLKENIETAFYDLLTHSPGCTDARALNYNKTAVRDDSSCKIPDFKGVF